MSWAEPAVIAIASGRISRRSENTPGTPCPFFRVGIVGRIGQSPQQRPGGCRRILPRKQTVDPRHQQDIALAVVPQ